ncbi:unnamed protein product, partial [Meganyctiphanes norvegica]
VSQPDEVALEELLSDLDSVKFLLQQQQRQQSVGFSSQQTQLLQHLSSDVKAWMQQWQSSAVTQSHNMTQQHATLITHIPQNTPEPVPVDTQTNTQLISVVDTSMHFVNAIDEGSESYIVGSDSKTQFVLPERRLNVQSPYIVTASMANSVRESEMAVRNLITNIPY